ncbi:DNA/RNA helicase, superfamily II [Clostridium sp. ASBs410]|nr:DNA/RNA helicase, superfamily II [Clostridium sp. ASBs410]
MVPLNELTAETLLSNEVLTEVFDQEDELYRAELLASLSLKATELKVKTEFKDMVTAYKKVEKEMKRQEMEKNKTPCYLDNWTNFSGPYDNMQCKEWLATENGICLRNPSTGYTDILACYHPILPIERLKNLETGEEQIKLAYKRNGRWEEIIVPKTMVTSANKIVSLSGRGIAVTSENAKYLVRYLADVENANEEHIAVQYSTSKLGWIRGGFLPYDTEIVFDGDARFRQIYESIGQDGSRTKWFDHASALRKAGRIEVKFMLAAAFSSVLVQPLGGLPYFVDLWGETEGGKTVSLMVAASVWGDPDESAYIKDYKGTEVGLEAICDLLNNLPLILDDSSKKNRKIEDNFEGLVYDLCSGKGKTRSNKDLGLNRENHWKNCILTNGERPLSSYVTQGGAINRILEIECGEHVFESPGNTAELVKRNYGHAGREFVEVIKELGIERIKEIQQEFANKLADDEKMQKQSLSLSIVLTADKIATDYLFKDGEYISLEEAKEVLVDRNELSDNERCYQFIMDKVAMNPARFNEDNENMEKWGVIENGYAIIYTTAFTALCRDGGFSKASFLSWASRKDLLQTDGIKSRKVLDKVKSFNGNKVRCVFLKLNNDVDKDGFVEIHGNVQEELPFK